MLKLTIQLFIGSIQWVVNDNFIWFISQTEGRGFNPGFGEYYLGGGNPAAHDSIAMESRNFEQIVAAPRVGYADSSEARDYNFKAGNTQSGRPVYYVVEEPDSLHADRSPYNFEPADNQGPII